MCTFRTDSSVSVEWETQRDLKEEVKGTSNAEKMQVRVRCHQEGTGTGLRLAGMETAGDRSALPSDTLYQMKRGGPTFLRADGNPLC